MSNTKPYATRRGQFMARWRVEPFTAAQSVVESLRETNSELAAKLTLEPGSHSINAIVISVADATQIDECLDQIEGAVYNCHVYGDTDRTAQPTCKMSSHARTKSYLEATDLVVDPQVFELCEAALQENKTKNAGQINSERLVREGYKSIQLAKTTALSLHEFRIISSVDLIENDQIKDGARALIAVSNGEGAIYPVNESIVMESPENYLVSTAVVKDWNKLRGSDKQFQNEIKTTVISRNEVKLEVRPYFAAEKVLREFAEAKLGPDAISSACGASQLRGTLDLWGPMCEHAEELVKVLREANVKIISAKGIKGITLDSIDDVNPFQVTSWR